MGGIGIEPTTSILELRTAINAMPAAAGLGAFSFTDPSLGAGTVVKKVHLDELRAAVAAARSLIPVPAFTFTDGTITAGATVIRIPHIQEIRSACE